MCCVPRAGKHPAQRLPVWVSVFQECKRHGSWRLLDFEFDKYKFGVARVDDIMFDPGLTRV